MSLVDQLPCGPVLTPAISCTKFQIHLEQATVPLPKQIFLFQFLGRTSLCFTEQETEEENELGEPTILWVSTYTSYLLYKVSDPFRTGNSPIAKTNFSFSILGRTSLCFTEQETQEENELGGPTPLWVSSYTSYVLYRVPDPLNTCRQSHGQNKFFFFNF